MVNGFQLVPVDADLKPAEMENYKSATDPAVRDQVESTLLEEIHEGNYILTDKKPTIVSALGAILKPDSDEVCLIHDCSQPQGKGLNAYVDIDKFSFQSLDDAIKLLGPNYFMAKIDLHHAYRSIPIHRSNFQATGLKWKFKGSRKLTYFVDTRLPFGGRRTL